MSIRIDNKVLNFCCLFLRCSLRFLFDLSGPAFSVVRLAWAGLRDSDAKNRGQHELIEMKLCVRHHNHESIPHAKFEADSLSSFRDTTSQIFPQNKGISNQIRLLPPENGFNLKKRVFNVQNRSSLPKVDLPPLPMSISAIFKQGKFSSFSKFLGGLDEKRASTTYLIYQIC